MNDIRFHAWDEVTKFYYREEDLIEFYDEQLSYTIDRGIPKIIIKDEHGMRELKLLRFTGKYDNEDVPIFEGDVIESFKKVNFRAEVYYEAPSFKLKWLDEKIANLRNSYQKDEKIPHNINIIGKVIGNIYEMKALNK